MVSRLNACIVALLVGGFISPTFAAEGVDPPKLDDVFQKTWFDGQAELAAYDLTIPRYGEQRHGTAVTVFCTEPFSKSQRVKADPGKHPDTDVVQVMKLNLVHDFSTGIYDYNIMTSSFVALGEVDGAPAGTPIKVSFNCQEWCGNVYAQLLFDSSQIHRTLHSYFDGEADQQDTLPAQAGGVSEDTVLLWARGFVAPVVGNGEDHPVPLLKSLQVSRLSHTPVTWQRATLSRSNQLEKINVPAGAFEVRQSKVEIEGSRVWTIWVEEAIPHRIIKWSCSDGESAEMLGSDRMKYWEMHGEGFQKDLSRLGLKPRPPRTP